MKWPLIGGSGNRAWIPLLELTSSRISSRANLISYFDVGEDEIRS